MAEAKKKKATPRKPATRKRTDVRDKTPLKPKSEPKEKLYKSPDKGGRPWAMTVETVTKLKMAFKMGFNIAEACSVADISRASYYRALKEFPELRDEFSNAMQTMNLTAKKNIGKKVIEGDIPASMWWAIHYGDAKNKLEQQQEEYVDDQPKALAYIESISQELGETIIDAEIVDEQISVKNTK